MIRYLIMMLWRTISEAIDGSFSARNAETDPVSSFFPRKEQKAAKEGIFARVIEGGTVNNGDNINIVNDSKTDGQN